MGKILENNKFVAILNDLAKGMTTKNIVKDTGASSYTVWTLANELPLWKAAREASRKAQES